MSKKLSLSSQILYEDDDLLVINKPAGVVVNYSYTVSAPTVQEWLAPLLPKSPAEAEWLDLVPSSYDPEFGTPLQIFEQRQGIVHRLDKDTSGALLLAKNPGALVNLLAQFKQRQVTKVYQCLVHGKFQVPESTIVGAVLRNPKERHKFIVDNSGKEAKTNYAVQQFYPNLNLEKVMAECEALNNYKKRAKIYQGFSLVNCQPLTGRTHQIRVHMAFIKHPLVSDQVYTGSKRAQLDPVWCPRQFLHATKLTFTHPRTRQLMTVEALLAAELEQALMYLLDV